MNINETIRALIEGKIEYSENHDDIFNLLIALTNRFLMDRFFDE
jgi:hypothetical protein